MRLDITKQIQRFATPTDPLPMSLLGVLSLCPLSALLRRRRVVPVLPIRYAVATPGLRQETRGRVE